MLYEIMKWWFILFILVPTGLCVICFTMGAISCLFGYINDKIDQTLNDKNK